MGRMFCMMSRILAWNLLESATSWTKGLGAWMQRLPLTWALTLPDLLLVGSGRGAGSAESAATWHPLGQTHRCHQNHPDPV